MDDKELKYVLKEYVMNKIEAYFVGHNFEKRDYSEDKIIYVIDEMLVILLKIEVKSDYCLQMTRSLALVLLATCTKAM